LRRADVAAASGMNGTRRCRAAMAPLLEHRVDVGPGRTPQGWMAAVDAGDPEATRQTPVADDIGQKVASDNQRRAWPERGTLG